jgi:hypothetical protein
MPAAMRPYSMAVAPDSSVRNRLRHVFILTPVHYAMASFASQRPPTTLMPSRLFCVTRYASERSCYLRFRYLSWTAQRGASRSDRRARMHGESRITLQLTPLSHPGWIIEVACPVADRPRLLLRSAAPDQLRRRHVRNASSRGRHAAIATGASTPCGSGC